MRILGTKPSLVILSQAKKFQKLKIKAAKKKAEAKRDGVINPQNYNFSQFSHGQFWCSQNATNQLKLTVELCCMCLGDSLVHQVTLTK